jgi:uncharacterized membrane protein
MTNEHSTHNELVAEGWGDFSVIAVTFEDDGNAYNALTLLKQLDSQHRVGVQEAVVAVRGEDGQVVEKDRIESMFLPSTVGVGLVGLLIGIIGGPFGMLIGGTAGLFAGSLFDIHDIDETESALGAISNSVKVGHPALLAVVTEQSPEVVDAAMSEVGGTVLRRSVFDVEAEIAAAEDAERKAKWEARKELVRSRHEHNRAAIGAKLEELKAKVRGEHPSDAASAEDAPQPAASGR